AEGSRPGPLSRTIPTVGPVRHPAPCGRQTLAGVVATWRPRPLVPVVEDEPDTCEFLDRFLRNNGADGIVARAAAGALSRIADCKVDIVVSDSGYQAHLAKPIERSELVLTISSFAGLIEARRRDREQEI